MILEKLKEIKIIFGKDGMPLIDLDAIKDHFIKVENKMQQKNIPVFRITKIAFLDENMDEILTDLAEEFMDFWGELNE